MHQLLGGLVLVESPPHLFSYLPGLGRLSEGPVDARRLRIVYPFSLEQFSHDDEQLQPGMLALELLG